MGSSPAGNDDKSQIIYITVPNVPLMITVRAPTPRDLGIDIYTDKVYNMEALPVPYLLALLRIAICSYHRVPS